MSRSPRHPVLLTAVLATLAVGCGSATEDAEPFPRPRESRSPEPARTPPCAPAREVAATPDDGEVLVFFACGSPVGPYSAFSRPAGAAESLATRLDVALRAYFAGPRREEKSGCTTFAGPGTLRSTSIVGTRAVIDLDLDGVGSSTSAQSQHLWTVLRRHAFQFPGITEMEPRHHGSCAAFGAAVEAGQCLVAQRDGAAVPGP